MFTQRNTENERGALMVEAIALLGLMTMMSPMVVRQTAERTSEMEEVAVAGQIKEIKDALSNYITANYATLTNTPSQNIIMRDVSAGDLAPYLSANALDGVHFRGNKLISSAANIPFRLATRSECTEKRNSVTGATAICPTVGTCVFGTNESCSRYRITGIVVSDGDEEIEDRRASRIASMIGADGGYMRTSSASTSLGVSNTDKTKIFGSQGIWEGDPTRFFSNTAFLTNKGGRVAATTVYTSGFSGDYLYRKKVDGLPDANSMFTDLDMGGAHDCGINSDGSCNKINNAGGLEVINGKILIRTKNAPDVAANVYTNTKVALGIDRSFINSGTSNIAIASGVDVSTNTQIVLNAHNNDSKLFMDANSATFNRGSSALNMTNDRVLLKRNATQLNMTDSMALLNQGDASLNLTNSYTVLSKGANSTLNLGASTANLTSGDINATASGIFSATANTKVSLNGAGSKVVLNSSEANMSVDNNNYLRFTTYDAKLKGDEETLIEGGSARLDLSEDYADLRAGNTANTGKLLLWGDGDGEVLLQSKDGLLTSYFGMQDAVINGGLSINGKGDKYTSHSQTDLTSAFSLTQSNYQVFVNNNKSRFRLDNAGFTIFNNSRTTRMIFKDQASGNGESANGKIALVATDAGSGVASGTPVLSVVSREKIGDESYERNAPIKFYAQTGRIDGSIFMPTAIFNSTSGGTFAMPNRTVEKRLNRLNVNINSGKATGSTYFVNSSNVNEAMSAHVKIDLSQGDSAYAPYNSNNDRAEHRGNKYFMVDPAFTSIMNDIKLTSRGGARLSEAMPNYILKGIYILSNSYAAGGWPCGAKSGGKIVSKCVFAMPYFTMRQMGVTDGGWEYRCRHQDYNVNPSAVTISSGNNKDSNHPMKGTCSEHVAKDTSQGDDPVKQYVGYVNFNYEGYAVNVRLDATNTGKTCSSSCGGDSGFTKSQTPQTSTYTECSSGYCWAHPFMGIVPAPGRGVEMQQAANSLYAQDEGACPDGYQAVMTLTPSTFELGKLTHFDSYAQAGQAIIRYNPGFQDFGGDTSFEDPMRAKFPIMQTGTKLGVITEPITVTRNNVDVTFEGSTVKESQQELRGWAVAMGTVTPDPYDDAGEAYIWNVGGIPANSWTAVAHTYCYFNPARFDMPNMSFGGSDDGTKTLTPQSNPALNYLIGN